MSTHPGSQHSRRRRWQARLRRLRTARLLPAETRFHLRNVAREQLLAARSLLDAAITRLERPEGKGP